jgi:hypothetical protein
MVARCCARIKAVHSSAGLYVNGVSHFVCLSVLCHANQVALTLSKSTLGIFIPEKEGSNVNEVVAVVEVQRFSI